jgi:hypothetical protein
MNRLRSIILLLLTTVVVLDMFERLIKMKFNLALLRYSIEVSAAGNA